MHVCACVCVCLCVSPYACRYQKAVFYEYTDATFTTRVTRSPSDAYLGLLGPVMRANVGDVIKVVFTNRLR